ncbi:MAG: tetratricopeptide repeat protein [Candidatus Omnitrophica bacterium]|nr:tetratricopeptide repeat protein [Candidatus Omnitrophota bacterium]MDD5436104.1 tetratricopeptide repeat protein [Candidatus Omnitrophota bacterium]
MIILLAYAASICLNAYFKHDLVSPKAEADIIQRIFGGLRVFVGDLAFMKAEEYHHRGLPFESALAYHQGESPFAGHEHNEALRKIDNTFERKTSLYYKLYSQVKVTKDSHLKPGEEKEVLPWFYVEVAFNPHDVRGYVLGGYWLERLGKNDEALKFLKEGNRNNPDSADIMAAIGSLYFKEGNDEKAVTYLERACRLWREGRDTNAASNKYEESDKLFAFDLLGSLYARRKEYSKALDIYTELLKFGPNPVIVEKVKKLENEAKPL